MRRPALLLILLTVLAMSCNDNKNTGTNPFFAEWDTPYGMPPFDEIKPEHFKPAYIEAMQRHYAEIDSIVNNPANPDFWNVIVAFDSSGEMLERVSRVFSNVNSADSNDQLREIESEMSPILTAHWDNINMNERLFAKVRAVYENRASVNLDPMQERLLEKTYRRFVRSGAELGETDKERLKEINAELAAAAITFSNNLLTANRDFVMMIDSADLAGLSLDVKEAAASRAEQLGEKGRFAFTLSKPSLIPFITQSERRDLRERLYTGYLNRCNYGDSTDNRPVINDLVRLRLERSRLLGYSDFAQYVLEDRMARDASEVYTLLNDLWEPSLQRAKEELEEMKEIMRSETGNDDFRSWDWWYYAEKVRKNKYDLDEEMVRPYFSLGNVQSGIFDLANRLYGVTFRPVNVPVYHRDCVTFEVLDVDNTHLGILLMDFHPRPGKKVGAWCSNFRGRTYIDGEKVSDPIVTIVCNFTEPAGRKPALLTLDETETFFHEFGHALHFLFTDVPYRGLVGTERDFVELPSQIMENWAFDPALLRRYAMHYSTNAAIPDLLIEKIRKSAAFNQGFLMTEHLAAAFSDMDIHTITSYEPLELNEYEAEMLNIRRGLIDEIAPRYRYPYFSHIFPGGYPAGYYSYKWAEVLDKDAFEAFAETGDVFNKKVAGKFRTEILSKGGSAEGMTLYRNFRGREPSRDFLLYARGLKERPAVLPTDTLMESEEGEDDIPVNETIVDAMDE